MILNFLSSILDGVFCSRIRNHVRMGKGSRIDPKIDGGIWYEKKRVLLLSNAENVVSRLPTLPAGHNV